MSAEVVDTATVLADDALLDALGGRDTDLAAAADELAVVLLEFRRAVDAEPVTALVSGRRARSVIRRAARATRFPNRLTRRTR